VLVGLLAVATLPVALAVDQYSDRVSLLGAGLAVPLAAALGIAAVWLGRSGRQRVERTLGRVRGRRLAFAGRALGYLGLYLAGTATLALGFYALLLYISE
jgi:hypothetical protein